METINGEGILAQTRESPSQYHLMSYAGLKLAVQTVIEIEDKKTGAIYVTAKDTFDKYFRKYLKKVKWRRIQRRYNNGTNK